MRAGLLHGDGEALQRRCVITFIQLSSASFHPPEPFTDQLRLAVAAYLARFKGTSREHTESDLRCYLGEEHGHRVLCVCGKGTKVVLVPLPPAVGRAIDRATDHGYAGQSCSTAAAPGWTGT